MSQKSHDGVELFLNLVCCSHNFVYLLREFTQMVFDEVEEGFI